MSVFKRCEGGCLPPFCPDLIFHNGYCLEPKVRMAAMALRQEQDVTVEQQLTPELQQRLESALAMYAMYQEGMEQERAVVEALLNEAGARKASSDTHDVYITTGGTSKSLNRAKLIAQGVTETMFLNATEIRPKRPFLTIKKKGAKDKSDDE